MAIKWKSSSSATGENVTSVVYNVNGSSVGTIYRVKKTDVSTTNNYVWAKPYSGKSFYNYNSGGTALASVTAHDEPSQTNGTKAYTSAASSSTPGISTASTLYYGDTVVITSTASSYKIRPYCSTTANTTANSILATNTSYSHTYTGGNLPMVTCCFLPDAQVMVALDGTTRNISDIQPGDPVVTYNKLTRELQLTECYQVYTREVSEMAEVIFDDKTSLILTEDHPFYDNNLDTYAINGSLGQPVKKDDGEMKIVHVLKSDNSSKVIIGLNKLEFEPDITTYDISVLQGSTIIVEGVVCMSAQDSVIEDFESENIIFQNKNLLAASNTKASGGTVEPNACNIRCSNSNSGAVTCCTISISGCNFLCSTSISSSCSTCNVSLSALCFTCATSQDSCDTACSTSASTMFC